tara:strand:- start:826 stop:1002 length:177 start_codon:yes stop_codon:yes gene_type:complete
MATVPIRLGLDVEPLGFLARNPRACLSFVFYREVDGSFISHYYANHNLAMVSLTTAPL